MTMRARQIRRDDFEKFDLLIAMDAANKRDLLRLAGPHRKKVRLLREFDPESPPNAEVPDPYYGSEAEFREVAEMIERAVDGIIKELS